MMGLSVAPPGIAEIAAQAATLALPAKSKAVLKDIADQLANLASRRTELAAMEQVDADRKKAIDKLKAELDAHAQDLASREQQLNARADKFTKVVAEFQSKLAVHEAALEAPDGNIA